MKLCHWPAARLLLCHPVLAGHGLGLVHGLGWGLGTPDLQASTISARENSKAKKFKQSFDRQTPELRVHQGKGSAKPLRALSGALLRSEGESETHGF